MASYAGFDLGLVFEMNAIPAPKDRQANAYPGVNGLELIDHGSRGGTTPLLAAFGSPTVFGLASLLQSMRTFQVAGTANVLVDQFGTAWNNVILDQFAPVGRIYIGTAGFMQRYQASFLHRT